MKKALILLLLLVPAAVPAQSDEYARDFDEIKSKLYGVDFILDYALFAEYAEPEIVIQVDNSGKKSAMKAAALSLLVPGAGQFYAGNKLRAAAFLLADVSLLFGRRQFRNQGDDITDEFRAYADQHWSRGDYTSWLNQQPDEVKDAFAHHLPDTNTQQYYEMIGKYHQFLAGWPDSEGQPDPSEMRLFYMGRQDDSNNKYKRADLLTNLMVLNRVVSAFEAALFVHRSNSKFRPGISFVPASDYSITPVANVIVSW